MEPQRNGLGHAEARMGQRRMPARTAHRPSRIADASGSPTLSPARRFCGDFTVPRIETPAPAVFAREYARIGRPVILTNLLQGTGAAQKWTPDYLIKVVGRQEAGLSKLRNHKLRSNNTRYTVPFADYAAAAFDNDPQARAYAMSQIELPPEIAPDLPTPELVGSWLRLTPFFWLSTPGHVTETHRDVHHNLLVQVIGTKKLTLFSPVFADALYAHDPRSVLNGYSRIDLDRPDLYRFPAARELTPTEITLRAGEALFLPVYWWHRVATLEVSVSVNFWWAAPLNLALTPQQAPGTATPEQVFAHVHAGADLSPFRSEFDVVVQLWSEGFPLFSAAYLYHCIAMLIAVKGRTTVPGRPYHALVRAASALARAGVVSEGDSRTIRSVLGSCRRAVELLGRRSRLAPEHGIADIGPLVAEARRLAAKLQCASHFRPSRWLPERPFGLSRDRTTC